VAPLLCALTWLASCSCTGPALAAPPPPVDPVEAAPAEAPVALSDAAWGRPASLRARALELQDRAVQRRVALQRLGEAATDEQRAAWAATEAADAAELDRIVTALANLEARPELREVEQVARRDAYAAVRALLTTTPAPEGVDPQRRLARLEADEAAYEALLDALRRWSGPLDPALAAPDLELLTDPERAPGAIERLGLLLGGLDPVAAEPIDDVLGQWSTAPVLQPIGAPLDESLAGALRARARWRAESVPGTFSGARTAADAVLAHLEAWPVRQADRSEQAERAQEEAAASQAAADRAVDAHVRSVLEQVARAKSRLASELDRPVFDPDEAPAPMSRAEVDALERELAQMGSWTSLLRRDPPLDPERQFEAVLDAIARLRQRERTRQAMAVADRELRAARETVQVESALVAAARDDLDTLPEEARAEVQAALVRWTSANEDWLAHLQERVDATAPRGWVERIQRLGRLKHRLIPEVSPRVFRRHLIGDARAEVAFVEPAVEYYGRNRRAMLGDQLSNLLTDGNALFQLINGSILAALLAVGWAFGRSRASSLALTIAKRIRQGRPDLRVADIRALRDPLARTIRNVVDLALGPLLLINLDALPELELLIRLYLYLAVYRVVLAGFDLFVVPADEARPALLVVRRETFSLLRRTVRAFTLTFVLAYFLEYVLGELLGLGTILWLTDAALWVWILGLTAWSLVTWEPVMRERLRRRFTEPSGPVRWLLPEQGGVLLVLPRALGQLLLLAVGLVAEGLHRFASEGTAASSLYNMFNRAVLRDDAANRPLEPDARAAIWEGPTPPKHLVEREELREVSAALVRWQDTHQRGLVAIVGDRGTGKHTAMDEIAERLKAAGMTVRRGVMAEPLRSREALSAWMGAAFGIPGEAHSNDDLVAMLESLEPSAILLEGVHHAFLRRVDGLVPLQSLLYALNAASHRHFLVCSVHGPAWNYFDAQGSLVDCGVFQTVVRLQPMDSQALRKITIGRAGEAGLRVDFSSLRVESLGSDRDLEADRARNMYYRLLAEASRGNPEVALQLFARSLMRTDDPAVVQVTLREVLEPEATLPGVGETARFVLVAINMHDRLTLDDLVEVTHLPQAEVRASVRDLVSRGLVARHADQLRLCDHRRPVVQRTLRRLHFLHLGPDG